MDNFFEYLPFIIGIAYFLFGGNKKKKKSPKPVNQRPKSPPQPKPSIEDILRELTGEGPRVPKPEPVAARPQTKPVVPKPEPVASAPYVDRIDHHANTGRTMSEIRQEIRDEKRMEEKGEVDFDLRQAVINDAVLNRPYP